MYSRVKAFTLIELLVVIVIMIIIMALVVPISKQMWNDVQRTSAIQQIRGMLENARSRARSLGDTSQEDKRGTSYGILFYVDRLDNQQRAVFVVSRGYPERALDENNRMIPNLSEEEQDNVDYRGLVCDRFEVTGKPYSFHGGWRVGRLNVDEWKIEADTFPQNHFLVIFSNDGMREKLARNGGYIIRDTDGILDPAKTNVVTPGTENGKGDLTGCSVIDVESWRDIRGVTRHLDGGPVRDILDVDGDGEFDWWMANIDEGFRIYNHNDYLDIIEDTVGAKQYIDNESYPILFVNSGGGIIRGTKGL